MDQKHDRDGLLHCLVRCHRNVVKPGLKSSPDRLLLRNAHCKEGREHVRHHTSQIFGVDIFNRGIIRLQSSLALRRWRIVGNSDVHLLFQHGLDIAYSRRD